MDPSYTHPPVRPRHLSKNPSAISCLEEEAGAGPAQQDFEGAEPYGPYAVVQRSKSRMKKLDTANTATESGGGGLSGSIAPGGGKGIARNKHLGRSCNMLYRRLDRDGSSASSSCAPSSCGPSGLSGSSGPSSKLIAQASARATGMMANHSLSVSASPSAAAAATTAAATATSTTTGGNSHSPSATCAQRVLSPQEMACNMRRIVSSAGRASHMGSPGQGSSPSPGTAARRLLSATAMLERATEDLQLDDVAEESAAAATMMMAERQRVCTKQGGAAALSAIGAAAGMAASSLRRGGPDGFTNDVAADDHEESDDDDQTADESDDDDATVAAESETDEEEVGTAEADGDVDLDPARHDWLQPSLRWTAAHTAYRSSAWTGGGRAGVSAFEAQNVLERPALLPWHSSGDDYAASRSSGSAAAEARRKGRGMGNLRSPQWVVFDFGVSTDLTRLSLCQAPRALPLLERASNPALRSTGGGGGGGGGGAWAGWDGSATAPRTFKVQVSADGPGGPWHTSSKHVAPEPCPDDGSNESASAVTRQQYVHTRARGRSNSAAPLRCTIPRCRCAARCRRLLGPAALLRAILR